MHYKLVAIVGPTASGKSDLAMKIAKEFDGEIICVDSRTIYKGMDIGTAKPTPEDQNAVRHWGLDLVEPGRRFSAAQFKAYAEVAIADIQCKGKLPILVGGTGLYIDAVIFDYSFSTANSERDPINPRHLKKAGELPQKKDLLAGSLIVGLLPLDGVLRERISSRAERMFEQGIVEETKGLVTKFGSDKISDTAGNIYKTVLRLLDGEIEQQQAIELSKTADWQYARRQKTWFKRNTQINWFSSPKAAEKFIQKQLMNT